MTQKSIDEQVEVLRITAEKFSVSREAASGFLKKAGIYSCRESSFNPNVTHAGKGASSVKSGKK